ncbi:MAG TPA: agarase [Bacteroides sp.]|nr:agarase [Bacteroides sp.]
MDRKIYILPIILCLSGCMQEKNTSDQNGYDNDSLIVQAKRRIYHADGRRTYSDWIDFQTRTVDQLDGYSSPKKPAKLNKYGGCREMKSAATGYFHVEKIGDRWWAIDPDGCRFIHMAVNSINTGRSERNKAAFTEKFGSKGKWINETNKMLHGWGFNGAGSWSDSQSIISSGRQSANPLAYTINISFMSGYGRERGGTFAVPGHTGFPNNTIFVFDEEFKQYCDKAAGKLTKYKDDPNLFGYFSDNELPFKPDALEGYLSLDNKSDQGYLAAKAWLDKKGIDDESINDEVRSEFLAFVADRYFETVSEAIQKYDPNHMFLGPRLYSSEKNNESFMKVAGKYVDVLACNYYGRWTPRPEEINNWTLWSGKPFIITEWYVKGEDSGLPNQTGAGWIVKTQEDRGLFYQNYTLALLESGNCVGWHWFKYQDNDPELKGAELSNIDANKGIVNIHYDEYNSCLELMSEINSQVYNLADYFDKNKTE